MVMFTCNRCSAGLKKNQVETHAFKCGGPSKIDLTCHDCLKDFRGKEYEAHTSCVSEEARYGGKNAVVKVAGKKQNQWREVVQNVLENNKSLEPDVLNFLKPVAHFENIPRKRGPFMNWAQNVAKCRDRAFLDKVFDILLAEFTKTQTESSPSKVSDDSKKPNGENAGTADDSSHTAIDKESQPQTNGEKKKKNKKSKSQKLDDESQAGNCESHELNHNEEGEVNENAEVPEKKKKKKKHVSTEENTEADDSTIEPESQNGVHNNDTKKKKKSTDSMCEEPMEVVEDGPTVNRELAETVPPKDNQEDAPKLSKKERKLLKKKAKFEAEVALIESEKKPTDDVEEEVVENKVKKSKKRKNDMGNGEDHDDGAKKPRVDIAENGAKEPAEEESPKKVKFNWHETILTVLRKSKHDEVPVKKVTKRVIDEYISLYGDKGIHEKLHAKMNKKLQTCPGVKVLKEKVKLVEGDA